MEQFPKSVQLIDNDGRTPLHFAAIVKDGGQMFNYLLSVGADESILDNVRISTYVLNSKLYRSYYRDKRQPRFIEAGATRSMPKYFKFYPNAQEWRRILFQLIGIGIS